MKRHLSTLILSGLILSSCNSSHNRGTSTTMGNVASDTANTQFEQSAVDETRPQPIDMSLPLVDEQLVTEDGYTRGATLPGEWKGERINHNFPDILFATDSADVGEDNNISLRMLARYIKRNESFRLIIGGHCDERGSDEYNLSLSEKRAEAVRRALIKLAPSIDSRIRTVAFGEEKPAAQGNDNQTFAVNRRADFQIISLSE